jgi:hypothetical protein
MQSYTRRELIGRALAAGAGATVLGTLETASALGAVAGNAGPDPRFLAGQLLTMKGSGSLVFADYDGAIRKAAIGSGSQIWRGGDWAAEPLALGDCVYARGLLGSDGVFAIDKLWVAIASDLTTVLEASGAGVTLNGARWGTFDAQITPHTEFIGEDSALVRGVPSGGLAPNDGVQVVGFFTRDGKFTASRVIKFDPNVQLSGSEFGPTVGEPQLVSTPEGPLTLCPYTWNGLSTFFCCGNVSGCNYSCGSSADGWCGGQSGCQNHCRSDGHYAAWKYIYCGSTNKTASCGDCCDTTLASVPCGQNMTVLNPCTNQQDTVSIVDDGPVMNCLSPYGCQSRTAIKFDLTPCAYSAIGGDYNTGHVTCSGTIYLTC